MPITRVAMLGANSQIASDLLRAWSAREDLEIHLFSRKPESLHERLRSSSANASTHARLQSFGYESFIARSASTYDVLINFVGAGDPARAIAMGAGILEITRRFDDMALDYIERHPDCRYIFLSSGAAYGSDFAEPVQRSTPATIDINHLTPQAFYSVAKLYAETRHRAAADRQIIDVRVFNIFSRTQDLSARFLITDIVRAIRDGAVLEVDGSEMVRDYLHPSDMVRLFDALMAAPGCNLPVDCYSKAPVSKQALLEAMSEWFDLRWTMRSGSAGVNATGRKPNYFSVDRRAGEFGYQPTLTSLEGLRLEISALQEHSQ